MKNDVKLEYDINDFTKKRGIQIIAFYVLLTLIGGYFISFLFQLSDKMVTTYTEVDQVIDNLQLKYSVAYIEKTDFSQLSSTTLNDIDYYKLNDTYYLVTTKDLLKGKDEQIINFNYLFSSEKLYFEIEEVFNSLKFKVDRLGYEDNSAFEETFNLTNIAIYDITVKETLKHTITASVFINFIMYVVGFIVIGFLAFDTLKKDSTNLSTGGNIIKSILLGLLILFLSNIISGVLTIIVKIITNDNTVIPLNQFRINEQLGSQFAAFLIISIVLFAPVIEELVFRKAIFSLFNNKWIALFVSSLLFGLIHVTGETNILALFVNLIVYSLSGFALGFIYIRSNKNVWIPIYVHLTYNLLVLLR